MQLGLLSCSYVGSEEKEFMCTCHSFNRVSKSGYFFSSRSDRKRIPLASFTQTVSQRK